MSMENMKPFISKTLKLSVMILSLTAGNSKGLGLHMKGEGRGRGRRRRRRRRRGRGRRRRRRRREGREGRREEIHTCSTDMDHLHQHLLVLDDGFSLQSLKVVLLISGVLVHYE